MRRISILILTLALAAGACSGADAEIARVGSMPILLADVDALLDGDTLPINEAFRETLFRVMAVESLRQALAAEFGATPDPQAAQTYLEELEASRAEQGLTPEDFLGVDNASVEMIRFNAEVLALRDAALEKLMVLPETVDGLFADPANLTTACVKHILVGTAEEAETVKARLAAGEAFAAVAAEVTQDTNTLDGDLGCAPVSTYVGEFAQAALEAPLGEVTGPVQTEFGFHVLLVSERTVLTRAEYLANPAASLSSAEISELWTRWFNSVLQSADGWVDPRYGTWTATGIRAPETSTTTTTSAG